MEIKLKGPTNCTLTFHFQYKRDGYLVLEDFFTEDEVNEMKEAGTKLTEDIPDEANRIRFTDTVKVKFKNAIFIKLNWRKKERTEIIYLKIS